MKTNLGFSGIRTIIVFLVISISYRGFAQDISIVGAWFWSDSSKQISLFFKDDGRISKYMGEKRKAILERDITEGQYEYTSNKLIIKWHDSKMEKFKVKFRDKYTFVLRYSVNEGEKPKQLFFRKVVDKEG